MTQFGVQSLAEEETVQYISNPEGHVTGVIVPTELWQDLMSELETQHLLKSETMRQRLLEACQRDGGVSLDQAVAQLGLQGERLNGLSWTPMCWTIWRGGLSRIEKRRYELSR